MIARGAPLGGSCVRGDMMPTLENNLGSGPEGQMKLGWSQSVFSNARLFCGQRCVAEATDRSRAARLAHQIPSVKRNKRLKAVNFLNGRCTGRIIALCSLKVNPRTAPSSHQPHWHPLHGPLDKISVEEQHTEACHQYGCAAYPFDVPGGTSNIKGFEKADGDGHGKENGTAAQRISHHEQCAVEDTCLERDESYDGDEDRYRARSNYQPKW